MATVGWVAEEWSIDGAAHQRFVRASGDRNPIHVDAEAARRTPFGRRAVHGVHVVLAALERLAAAGVLVRRPRRVSSTFRRSVTPGDALSSDVSTAGGGMTISVTHDVWVVAQLRVELDDDDAGPPTDVDRAATDSSELRDLSLDDLVGMVGTAEPFVVDDHSNELAELFPAFTELLGIGAIAEIAGLSRLVGMTAPGRHSLLSRFDAARASGDGRDRSTPTWTLRSVDDRFRLARLAIDGQTIEASVEAFLRPAPVDPQLDGAAPDPERFAGQRWLIVGGSRGLGAVVSMLLDAGGAEVCATHLGSPTAADDLVSRLDRTHTVRFDVDDVAGGLRQLGDWQPTHLGWFVSPPIFDGAADEWSDRRHAKLLDVYVHRFAETIELLDPATLVGVLWPSTVAVTEPVRGLAEYADAKRRGEEALDVLAADQPHLQISRPRLPRLATDQTTSVVPVDNAPPGPVMLDALAPFATPAPDEPDR